MLPREGRAGKDVLVWRCSKKGKCRASVLYGKYAVALKTGTVGWGDLDGVNVVSEGAVVTIRLTDDALADPSDAAACMADVNDAGGWLEAAGVIDAGSRMEAGANDLIFHDADAHRRVSSLIDGCCWRAGYLPRTKGFLCCLLLNAVPTSVFLHDRGLLATPTCPWGCDVVGDLQHAFLQCPFANRVHIEAMTLSTSCWPLVELNVLFQWMKHGLEVDHNCCVPSLISNLIYYIWKTRNSYVHWELFPTPRRIAVEA